MKVWAITMWLRVQEPKLVTLYQTLIYMFLALAGFSALIEPPHSIAGALGPWLTGWWALMASVGGLLGMFSCPWGVWWLERVSLLLCTGGVGIYAMTVASLHFIETGSLVVQTMMALMMVLHFAARYARIRTSAYDPEK